MNALMSFVKQHVDFKNNQDAEAKAVRMEELNNFESMLLENCCLKMAKLKAASEKKGSGKRQKGVYKSL